MESDYMDKQKVLITGANGQLGKDLVDYFATKYAEVYGFGREELDITNIDLVIKTMENLNPNVVIHAGAYTKVDLAETEPEEAYRINAVGTRNIAVASEAIRAKLAYVSTDYVFDGMSHIPYDEFHSTNPSSIYGKSKLAGEQLVQSLHSQYFIIRTSWVYGIHGNNFVKTMLRLAQEKESVSVVNDQIGSPTYTIDLSKCIADLLQTQKYGIYHVSNSGHCSWYEFAVAIFEEAGMNIQVVPVSTEAFPRPAKRPPFSILDHKALRLNDFPEMRNWRDALKAFIAEMELLYADSKTISNGMKS
jgi:dTDP-4-dehydrorhamnose reductase